MYPVYVEISGAARGARAGGRLPAALAPADLTIRGGVYPPSVTMRRRWGSRGLTVGRLLRLRIIMRLMTYLGTLRLG